MKVARWKNWLEDEELRLWFEDVSRGSPVTAEENIRVLYRYCRLVQTTPQQLVLEARKDTRTVENQLLRFIGDLERKGKAPQYVFNYVKAAKSWLNHQSVPLRRRIRVRDRSATPTLENEQVPTKEELGGVFHNATLRGRVVISMMAFTGIRPQVMGNCKGSDGLRLADLPDLRIEGKKVCFEKVPCQENPAGFAGRLFPHRSPAGV